jgi:hypothetical protein
MAYQGEYFVERYGARAAEATPPVKRMLEKGVHVSAGTDATRVASYNPWVSLSWLITGKTVGGLQLTPQRNCLDRETALRMWTENVTWFSNEVGKKGRIQAGQLADLVVPDRDFFACPESEIADTSALLTVVGGKVVWAAGEFARWTRPRRRPCRTGRRCGASAATAPGAAKAARAAPRRCRRPCAGRPRPAAAPAPAGAWPRPCAAWAGSIPADDLTSFWGALGCACWAL